VITFIAAILFSLVSANAAQPVFVIGGTGRAGMQVAIQESKAGKDVVIIGTSSPDSDKVKETSSIGKYVQLDVLEDIRKFVALIEAQKPQTIYFFGEPNAYSIEDAAEPLIRKVRRFYSEVASSSFSGRIVVAGTMAIDKEGPGFPTHFDDDFQTIMPNASESRRKRRIGAIDSHPIFRCRKAYVDASRESFPLQGTKNGAQMIRIGLPWVISGDAYHKTDPLFIVAEGGFNKIGMNRPTLNVLSAKEAARIVRFAAEHGESGWTYWASGTNSIISTDIVAAQAKAAGIQMPKLVEEVDSDAIWSSFDDVLNMRSMSQAANRFSELAERFYNPFPRLWFGAMESFGRSMMGIPKNKSSAELQYQTLAMLEVSAAQSIIRGPSPALAKLGFKPQNVAAQKKEIMESARQYGELIRRRGALAANDCETALQSSK
jgi:nucleoside-diphosphate-sugar epimerase